MNPNDTFRKYISVEYREPLSRELYRYATLPHRYIRLLSLDGVGIENMISCTLYQAPLEQPLTGNRRRDYCALSYRWGDPSPVDTWILVCEKKVQIRKNLFSLLCQAAQASRIATCPYLWIDALCINQGSIFERNHQVQMMDRIYSHAVQVVVWLGEDESGNSPLFVNFRKGLAQSLEHCDDIHIASLELLIQLEYWSRIRVVQEIRHAPSSGLLIMYGAQLILWDDFWNIAADLLAEKRCIPTVLYRKSTRSCTERA